MSVHKILTAAFFLLICAESFAQGTVYKDWRIDYDSNVGILVSETINENGSSFGQMCVISDGSCSYVLKGDTPCRNGETYGALINSTSSAFHTLIKCIAYSGVYYYEFQSFEDINNSVMKDAKIGIVYPLEGGNFKVYRFSLIGAKQATDAMRNAAERAFKEGGNSGSASNSLL